MVCNHQRGELITDLQPRESVDTQAIYNAAGVDWRLPIGRFDWITAAPIKDASEQEAGSGPSRLQKGPILTRESQSCICIIGRITHVNITINSH